jgi:hypothetical protein
LIVTEGSATLWGGQEISSIISTVCANRCLGTVDAGR